MPKLTTVLFLITSATLAVLHFLALEFYLYWQYPWLDIYMHALGGSVVALGYWSLRDFRRRLPAIMFSLLPTLLIVFVVALLWEVFEAMDGLSLDAPDFVADTLSDLLFGLVGGSFAFIVARRLNDLQ